MSREYNEFTRVQMPALVHLTRLGYKYYGRLNESKVNIEYDPDTNILLNVFKEQFVKLNPDKEGEVEQVLLSIKQELDNDDLGKSFYNRIQAISPLRLIEYGLSAG